MKQFPLSLLKELPIVYLGMLGIHLAGRKGKSMSMKLSGGMKTIDLRTNRGKELAERINRETILEQMPKLYFVEDPYNGGYRVGRTDWAGDMFDIVPKADFETFRRIYESLNMPLLDKTDEE